MPEAMITYFGQPAKVACDGKCEKAWGINNRPGVRVGIDDFKFCDDSELTTAPIDPGTCEGGHRKPPSAEYFPNKWRVRECERCVMSKFGQSDRPLSLPTF